MKIAIVGCGGIGQRYSTILKDFAEVVAVCDPDQTRAAEAAAKCGAKPYASVEEALAAEAIDVVFITTSTRFHKPVFMSVLAAGKHIFLEKPMAETLSDASDMVAAHAATKDQVFGFGFKLRFESTFVEAKKIVESGEIGEVRTIAFTYSQSVPAGERIWYVDSGILNEMHIHGLDLVTWWANSKPKTVTADLGYELGRKGEDSAWTEIRFANGVRSVVHGAYYPDFPNVSGKSDISFQIVGTKGHIVGYRPNVLHITSTQRTETLQLLFEDPFITELRAFVQSMDAGKGAPVTGEAGIVAQQVIDAAKRSAKEGKAVAIG